MVRGLKRPKVPNKKRMALRNARWNASASVPDRERLVKSKIELQDVHSRVAKKPEGRPFGQLCDQTGYLLSADSPRFGHARSLSSRRIRADVRIEAAGRGR